MTNRLPLQSDFIAGNPRFNEMGFEFHRGWDEELASQLVMQSLEPAILAATPRDAAERFPNIASAMEWYDSKPKVAYSLFRAAELAGFIWFSEQPFRSAERTFAIRMYEPARGQHVSQTFALASHFDHEMSEGYEGDTWLETGVSNDPARGLFPKLRYKEVLAPDIPTDRVRMIRPGIARTLDTSRRHLNE